MMSREGWEILFLLAFMGGILAGVFALIILLAPR
jgi:hypothetical protein